ncbi:hypothetical protein A1O1_05314 [Capronia coronata CBS 617.96]|uniref:Exonuclease domain-containing protein n=1 Tax=Capronia coronata CBS 617.96 TaxID=1182541 RepID=W9Z1K9_9EURO|nr:uncharacterized protein A1O1_05314 [Capronia coronata CBS 617.96]EXJ88384.1 hypothetical protein A1O1_05314 [Capronia coronata CBS 617.96]
MVAGSKRTAADAGLFPPALKAGQTVLNTTKPLPKPHSPQRQPSPFVDMQTARSADPAQDSKVGEDEGDWLVAESRSSRKKRRKVQHDPEGQPSIAFLDTRPARIQLKALQELVLYLLADGAAPSWLAIKNARRIEKVVVLMIPGLDRELLEKSDLLASASTAGGTGPDTGHSRSIESANVSSTSIPSLDESDAPDVDIPSEEELTRRLLQHVFEVKAPGDSRANRVHSPLQGMLIAPLPETKDEGGKDERFFQSARTSIATFVHTAEELREAEYPIHHAAFTDAKDAQLERDRREQTSQSASAGWVDTNVSVSQPRIPSTFRSEDAVTQGLQPYAVDCEMVLTDDDKSSLARISVVDWHGKTVLDKYVKPALPIKNYFTQYSGITPRHLEDVTTTLEDIQRSLLELLGPDSILLGHSLESDLNALKLTHPFIIDTSIIYPHPRGLPLRSSLKFLANRYLKREIQKQGLNGHDSVEDARAVLDLVRLKCEKGPRWGTLDANGESIFRRIGRSVRPDGSGKLRETAIVEYGTPERGFGRDATYKIACENDDEIVQGVLRAAHGGDTSPDMPADSTTHPADEIPAGGVDFIWSRLRDLEAVRGWNNLPQSSTTSTTGEASTSNNTETTTNAVDDPSTDSTSTTTSNSADLHAAASLTLTRLRTLFASLPPRTLLVAYSGTSDMRPVLHMQQLHAQYRREFKVKKWDELSVQWTDVEEQKLRLAVDRARKGVGLLALR